MLMSNNLRTIYNLILYSEGKYLYKFHYNYKDITLNHQNFCYSCLGQLLNGSKGIYENMCPYGNLNKMDFTSGTVIKKNRKDYVFNE